MSIVEVHQQDGNGNSSTNACVLPQLRGLKIGKNNEKSNGF